jgi:hypothetical protein
VAKDEVDDIDHQGEDQNPRKKAYDVQEDHGDYQGDDQEDDVFQEGPAPSALSWNLTSHVSIYLFFEMIIISPRSSLSAQNPFVSDVVLEEPVDEVYDDGEEGEPEYDPYKVPEEGYDHHRQDQKDDVLLAAPDPP